MSEFYREVQLKDLSSRDIKNLRYDAAGQLVLLQVDSSIEQRETYSNVKKLTIEEKADLKAALYWLEVYEPEPEATNLEQVRGYLEAFHHLCELSFWQEAAELLFMTPKLKVVDLETSSSPTTEEELHKQLITWGYYREVVELYERLLSKLNTDLDCILLQGLGRASCYQGQLEKAINFHQQQLQLAIQIKNRKSQGQALRGLGLAYARLGQFQKENRYCQQYLEIAYELNDLDDIALALNALGSSYGIMGYEKKEIKYHQQALIIARQTGNQEIQAKVLGSLGVSYCDNGKTRQGIAYIQQHLENSIQTGNRGENWRALVHLGKSYMVLADYQKGNEYLNQALVIVREIGDKYGEMFILGAFGASYARTKEYHLAIDCLQLASKLNREMGNQYSAIINLANLAYCCSQLKQHSKAMRYVKKAIVVARKSDDRRNKGMVLAILANAYWQQGKYVLGLLVIARSILRLLSWWRWESFQFIWKRTVEEISQGILRGITHLIRFLPFNR